MFNLLTRSASSWSKSASRRCPFPESAQSTFSSSSLLHFSLSPTLPETQRSTQPLTFPSCLGRGGHNSVVFPCRHRHQILGTQSGLPLWEAWSMAEAERFAQIVAFFAFSTLTTINPQHFHRIIAQELISWRWIILITMGAWNQKCLFAFDQSFLVLNLEWPIPH